MKIMTDDEAMEKMYFKGLTHKPDKDTIYYESVCSRFQTRHEKAYKVTSLRGFYYVFLLKNQFEKFSKFPYKIESLDDAKYIGEIWIIASGAANFFEQAMDYLKATEERKILLEKNNVSETNTEILCF